MKTHQEAAPRPVGVLARHARAPTGRKAVLPVNVLIVREIAPYPSTVTSSNTRRPG
jgi:hypothetical protein